MQTAAKYYHDQVATRGGYVYHYTPDLQVRWGEGRATATEIWVQPPGTPTVGMAYLEAYRATHDSFYLQAATEAGLALIYGQLKSGGWTNLIDFDPTGDRVSQYRNGRGGGKNHSSLDDDQTTAALRLMIALDDAHRRQHPAIQESTMIGLEALLEAQFPNGGFPQVWDEPVPDRPVVPARYPAHDWRDEGRVKNYWDMYTLNDNVTGNVAQTLAAAARVYEEPRYTVALQKLGGFLRLAQMPPPQRGWAQQYNEAMEPIWARKFEPPAIAGDETQEAVSTLLSIARFTGEPRFLDPVPEALAWLKRVQLPDGQLARYYELRTDRPLYMTRDGDRYSLTYDDANLPSHYGWKASARIDAIEAEYRATKAGKPFPAAPSDASLARKAAEAIASLDTQGRWVSRFDGERLVGQPQFAGGDRYLSSQVFADNLTTLSRYLRRLAP
jgi:hypothetical protein